MKTISTRIIAFSTLALFAGLAHAGIANTKHNLGVNGTGTNHLNGADGTAEICVFCHTPHGSDTNAPAPLWNKLLPTGKTYTVYSSVTMDAARATDGTSGTASIGSVSVACLSCHDGTQAMDNIINAPGSGLYDATGGGANGRDSATGTAWTWSQGGEGFIGTAVTNLGTDLSNDHPIGIQYCGGGQTTTAKTGACVDGDFYAPLNADINGTTVWWVDTDASGTRGKHDMILYTRTFDTVTGPSVECASCHDPHVESFNATNQVSFLRVSQANSGLCLSCHNK